MQLHKKKKTSDLTKIFIHEKITRLSRALEEDTQLTRNLTNTSEASHTVVPKCLELGSY